MIQQASLELSLHLIVETSNTSWSTLSHEQRAKHTGTRPLDIRPVPPWPFQPSHLSCRGSLTNSSIYKNPREVKWSVWSLGQTEILTHWGRAQCSRLTLRDWTCLWTELLHSPNRKWGSGTSQDVNAFLRLWVRIEGNSCGLCVWRTVPLPQKGTVSAHGSPSIHTWNLSLGSTAQLSSETNHNPISCQVLKKNGGFFPIDHLGEPAHHLSDGDHPGLYFYLHKSEPPVCILSKHFIVLILQNHRLKPGPQGYVGWGGFHNLTGLCGLPTSIQLSWPDSAFEMSSIPG